MWGARPLWNCRNIITKSGVVNLVDEEAEESSSFFTWVRLELWVDLDDEGRCDSREQTGL